ncbi:hypothetical protein [Pantoea sp. GM01]|uniref:hypothetical protein n=1 Tax=Pantoea sp. GM01 TaxID=1144320 RepID=UPI000270F7E3|nr:hypothetical protein [Pantoea sp. GM01]EJL93199.1 hypothetical protein PMI17_00468 [Pantoea sp. GM01]
MNIASLKTLSLGLAALALSGCSTLIGSKFYDSGVKAAIYDDTKHELTKSTKQVILTKNLNGTYGLITDESDHFIIIAGTPHFDKSNLQESIQPFKDFLR